MQAHWVMKHILDIRQPFTARKIPGTHFCYGLSRPQGYSAEGFGETKNLITTLVIEPATFRLVAIQIIIASSNIKSEFSTARPYMNSQSTR
jgi:hypothetical protein